MADNSGSSGNHEVVFNINGDATRKCESIEEDCVPLLQKLVAEVIGTYFLIFAGCASVVVNLNNDKVVTLPGISIVWGLAVMVLVYSIGHISGAHFNPAVTIAHATTKRFPFKQVPAYIIAQVIGSTLASGTLRLIFSGKENQFTGTLPAGSDLQAFVIEFIITFYLMFIISGVATDNRAIGELAGLAVGSTVLLNVLFAGPSTGDWSINESSKKLRTCYCAQSVQRNMDIHGITDSGCCGWYVDLQFHQTNQQASA